MENGVAKVCSWLEKQQIAENLCVDESTVYRTIDLFERTGTVSKRVYPKDQAYREFTSTDQLFILNLVLKQPGIYLHEMQQELEENLFLKISVSTICRFLHQSGFSRQRMKNVAIQQDRVLREQYVIDMSLYAPEMLVFVDETGADRRNRLRKYGYSVRGKPPINHTLLYRGQRVSAIACLSLKGLLDIRTVNGTTDGDEFYDFVHINLMPHLCPFNGSNPHSVVVMDNCSIHHCSEITEVFSDIGVMLHFLPPYSPDYNPIEEAFSKVKAQMQIIELEHDHMDTETALLASFTAITETDCRGWISHPRIYNC